MAFTAIPVDGSATPIPMSSAVPDGTNTPLATEGGPTKSTGGNTLVPVAVYEYDGYDVNAGSTTDTAVTGDVTGTVSAKLRGLSKIFADMWDSTNHWLQVKIMNANANGQATMANSSPVVVASDQSPVAFNLKQVNGATLSYSNPNIAEDTIRNAIRNGFGYVAVSAGLSTATNTNLTVCPMSVFNPSSSGLTVLIYSIQVMLNASALSGANTLRLTTADPSGTAGFTNVITPSNLKSGGAASTISCSSSPNGITASITPTGTIISQYGAIGNQPQELLTNGAVIPLPSGVASGIEVNELVTTAGNVFSATVKWIVL